MAEALSTRTLVPRFYYIVRKLAERRGITIICFDVIRFHFATPTFSNRSCAQQKPKLSLRAN